MKILVVDDDPMAGMLTGAILEEGGHEVINAENGVEAVDLLEQDASIEMVISDMNMPLITGIELYHTLREQQVMLPFILLTGTVVPDVAQQAPGLDACVMKDADLADSLLVVVQDVMARRG